MRPYVELYIADSMVEFTNPPEIFMTYAHEDLHNPTVVKNSYSKTVTIDGTPRNNQIFGCFFNMQREVGSGYEGTGANFNASKRVPFALYRNRERMEHGYCKLDGVKRNGNMIQYNITLYGGLGQFFYNLSTKSDGEKMKLSDLDFGGGDKEFDLAVDKTAITKAWRHVNGINDYGEIYDKINFAPCYNGIPKDFSADKVAIDVNSFQGNNPQLYKQFITSKSGYTTVDGWVMGEMEKEYDEWQVKDLRSYLQRPVIRFKEIIDACCDKRNNGGYKVDLDEDFFNENNPYYEDAWMTLPLITEIEQTEEKPISLSQSDGKITLSGINAGKKGRLSIKVKLGVDADATDNLSTMYTYSEASVGAGTFVSRVADVGRMVQLVAYNSSGTAIAGSTIKMFRSSGLGSYNFDYSSKVAYKTTVEMVQGEYIKTPLIYYFGDNYYDFQINFTYEDGMYFKIVDDLVSGGDGSRKGDVTKLYSGGKSVEVESTSNETYDPVASDLSAKSRMVTKKALLNSEHTPCDYFLSYLKMFNLHIWQEDDETVYVRLRKNYFTGVEYDLDELVDRGSDINITPLTFDNKWYNFNNEVIETSLSKDYKDEYGIPYGIQKVDTNYNFDVSSKNLFEDNVFKNTIQHRAKSRYYTTIYQPYTDDDVFYPPFMLDGVQTFLYNNSGDTIEGSYLTPKTSQQSIQWWKDKYYDILPKPCFTDAKNEPVDGANVLLFYNGKLEAKDVDGNYINFAVTDDIPQFEILNEGEPCWIWSLDWDISDYVNARYLPVFSRYKTNENNWITHSWDFGTPKALYIPDYQIDDSSNLYTQYWRPYIRDRYDVNTRVVDCKVLLMERVVGEWLRRFYFWDGCWWIMNKIEDYNPTSNGTTKCEMVKINDPQNYR